MASKFSSKDLSHLGIVGGMIDELGIAEAIDQQLQIGGISRNVSIGILCKALIINGLWVSQRTLYLVSCLSIGRNVISSFFAATTGSDYFWRK